MGQGAACNLPFPQPSPLRCLQDERFRKPVEAALGRQIGQRQRGRPPVTRCTKINHYDPITLLLTPPPSRSPGEILRISLWEAFFPCHVAQTGDPLENLPGRLALHRCHSGTVRQIGPARTVVPEIFTHRPPPPSDKHIFPVPYASSPSLDQSTRAGKSAFSFV